MNEDLNYWSVAFAFGRDDSGKRTHGAYAHYEKRYENIKLRKLWKQSGEGEVDMLYQGPDRKEALKSIEGLEGIGDEEFIRRFGFS